MGIIPKVRNTKRKNIYNVQHLVDKTIKLAVTFLQNFEKVVKLCSVVAMQCFKVFPKGKHKGHQAFS